MNKQHGSPKSAFDQIVALLERFSEAQTAILFGSRAKGQP